VTAAEVARALGAASRSGEWWRSTCPLHGYVPNAARRWGLCVGNRAVAENPTLAAMTMTWCAGFGDWAVRLSIALSPAGGSV